MGRKKGDGRGFTDDEKNRNPVNQANDQTNVDESVNKRALGFGMELMNLPDVDFSDCEQVRERLMTYFELCDKYTIKPMVASMANAFGTDRTAFRQICSGSPRYDHWKNITPESANILKKAYNFLETSIEIYLSEEKASPVKWLFLAKNNFGYEDTTVHVARKEEDIKVFASPEQISSRYLGMVGGNTPKLPETEVEYEVLDD